MPLPAKSDHRDLPISGESCADLSISLAIPPYPTRLWHYCSSVLHFLAKLPEEARFPVKSKKRLEALTFPDSPIPWLTTNSPAPVTKRSISIRIYDLGPSMGAGM